MQILRLFVVIGLISGVKLTDDCGPGWFGYSCMYKCRCTDEKCDKNGECIDGAGCEEGRYGPACQYVLPFCAEAAKIALTCVRLVKKPASWKDAKAACEAMGPTDAVALADLVLPEVREYIQNMTKANTDQSYLFWLGGTDVQTEGRWMWSYTYSQTDAMIPGSWWQPGQPDNYYGNEDCLTIRYDGLLNDYRCYEKLPYFCQTA